MLCSINAVAFSPRAWYGARLDATWKRTAPSDQMSTAGPYGEGLGGLFKVIRCFDRRGQEEELTDLQHDDASVVARSHIAGSPDTPLARSRVGCHKMSSGKFRCP